MRYLHLQQEDWKSHVIYMFPAVFQLLFVFEQICLVYYLRPSSHSISVNQSEEVNFFVSWRYIILLMVLGI